MTESIKFSEQINHITQFASYSLKREVPSISVYQISLILHSSSGSLTSSLLFRFLTNFLKGYHEFTLNYWLFYGLFFVIVQQFIFHMILINAINQQFKQIDVSAQLFSKEFYVKHLSFCFQTNFPYIGFLNTLDSTIFPLGLLFSS